MLEVWNLFLQIFHLWRIFIFFSHLILYKHTARGPTASTCQFLAINSTWVSCATFFFNHSPSNRAIIADCCADPYIIVVTLSYCSTIFYIVFAIFQVLLGFIIKLERTLRVSSFLIGQLFHQRNHLSGQNPCLTSGRYSRSRHHFPS